MHRWGRACASTVLLAGAALGASCGSLVEGGDPGVPLWRTALEERDRNTAGTPASDGERVYAIAGGVVAFDARDGALLWRNRLPGEGVRPKNVVVENGRVFVAGGTVFALDARSGAELWRFRLPLPDSASAGLGRISADEKAVYVGTDTHQVFALDAATGAVRWSADVGPDWPHRGIVTGITPAGDTLFVSARQFNAHNGHVSSGWIIGLDRETGRAVWSFRSGTGSDWRTVSAGVSVAGPLLLASDHLHGSAFAVSRETGREVWRHDGLADKFGPLTSPVPVDGTAYFASMDGYVYAVDVATGALRWKSRNSGSNLSFAVCRGQVFTSYMTLAIMDRRSGRVLRRSEGREIFSEFAVAGPFAFTFSDRAAYAYRCR